MNSRKNTSWNSRERQGPVCVRVATLMMSALDFYFLTTALFIHCLQVIFTHDLIHCSWHETDTYRRVVHLTFSEGKTAVPLPAQGEFTTVQPLSLSLSLSLSSAAVSDHAGGTMPAITPAIPTFVSLSGHVGC